MSKGYLLGCVVATVRTHRTLGNLTHRRLHTVFRILQGFARITVMLSQPWKVSDGIGGLSMDLKTNGIGLWVR